jgi:hypothetical protein
MEHHAVDSFAEGKVWSLHRRIEEGSRETAVPNIMTIPVKLNATWDWNVRENKGENSSRAAWFQASSIKWGGCWVKLGLLMALSWISRQRAHWCALQVASLGGMVQGGTEKRQDMSSPSAGQEGQRRSCRSHALPPLQPAYPRCKRRCCPG